MGTKYPNVGVEVKPYNKYPAEEWTIPSINWYNESTTVTNV
jgi:hypothetical protein